MILKKLRHIDSVYNVHSSFRLSWYKNPKSSTTCNLQDQAHQEILSATFHLSCTVWKNIKKTTLLSCNLWRNYVNIPYVFHIITILHRKYVGKTNSYKVRNHENKANYDISNYFYFYWSQNYWTQNINFT